MPSIGCCARKIFPCAVFASKDRSSTSRTLTLTPRRTWQLDLQGEADDQRFTLVLDHDQPRRRLERFIGVYRSNLAPQLTAIRQVDLRYANGFAVQWQRGFDPARVAHRTTSGNE